MRVPAYDGLRALAAVGVIWSHTGLGREAGTTAMEVFFTLSGFLLGGSLLDQMSQPASAYYGGFYLRRTRRIWPLYFTVLIYITSCLDNADFPSWTFWAFVCNIPMAFGPWPTHGGVLWSLAVEEQFYLVLPAFLRHLRSKDVPAAAGVVIIGAAVFRLIIPTGAYLLLCCRMDDFAWGVLAAWGVRNRPTAVPAVQRVAFILLGWELAVPRPWAIEATSLWSLVVGKTVGGCATACLLYLLALGAAEPIRRLLSLRPLVYLGEVSYGLYLLHLFSVAPALTIIRALSLRYPTLWVVHEPLFFFALVLTITTVAASVSWRFIERPFIKGGWWC